MDKKEQHREYVDLIHRTYIRKNSDYGDSFSESMDEYGLTSALIRMGDKMSRLKSLSKHTGSAQVLDESLQDTLLDLANYAIMTAIWLKEKDEGKFKFFEGDDDWSSAGASMIECEDALGTYYKVLSEDKTLEGE